MQLGALLLGATFAFVVAELSLRTWRPQQTYSHLISMIGAQYTKTMMV